MSSASRWQTIRPWTGINRLSLQIREITSVSVTFILSSLSYLPPSSSSYSSDEDELDDEFDNPSISDLLGRGLAVKVNGIPWENVVMHVDEDAEDDEEEAIIILYGLMPSRVYDIELSVVAREKESIRGNLTTEAELDPEIVTYEDTTDLESNPVFPLSSTVVSISSTSQQPSSTSSTPIIIEDRLSHLRQTLSTLLADRATLTTQLKSARRDSQKSIASLRSEIEALKRTSEKNVLTDQRTRQRIRALQEGIKQSQGAASEMDEQVSFIEGTELKELEKREKELEEVYEQAESERKKIEGEREATLKEERKKVAELEAESAGLGNKFDKIMSRRDKLANEVVPDLQEQLAAITKEIEEVKKGSSLVLHDLKDFDHATHYPHHYLVPPLPRPSFPPPIQRPPPLPAEISTHPLANLSSRATLPMHSTELNPHSSP